MDRNARRLFDDGQVLIFEIDLERNLLWCDAWRFKDTEIHFDGFRTSNTVAGFVLASVDPNRSGPIEKLNLRTGEVLQTLS